MPKQEANTGRQNWSNLATPNVYVDQVEKLAVQPNYEDFSSKIRSFSDLKTFVTALNSTNETIASYTHFLQAESPSAKWQF